MGGASYSILVADDNPDVVESVSSSLRQLGDKFKDRISIFPASCGTDVLRILAQHQIDVLFLDYYFEGGMGGDDIINEIHDPLGQKLIILMSGRNEREIEGTVIKGHKHFGRRFRFLRKPFDYLELEAKYLEIEQFFVSLPYPFPLAHAYNAISASSTALGRLTAMKDLIELIAGYSVAVLMSDLARLNTTDGFTINMNWNLGMTLGAWLKWLNYLVRYIYPQRDLAFMPEMLDILGSKEAGETGHIKLMDKFKNEIRNQELSHGYSKEEMWYATLASEYDRMTRSLFEDFAFTSRYPLFVPVKVDFFGDDLNGYRYNIRLLMGAKTNFPLEEIKSKSRLRIGEVYLYNSRDYSLSLFPFFAYKICRKCSLSRLYLLDRVSQTKIEYNAFCNHRYASEESKSVFDLKFANLQGEIEN